MTQWEVGGEVATDYVRKGQRRGLHGGGLPRTTYYSPDGREIQAIPRIVESVVRATGQATKIDTRIREGWSLTPYPEDQRKPYCKGCDKWHDTQEQVDECVSKKQKFVSKHEKEAQADTDVLTARIDKLEGMFMQIMEKLGGASSDSDSTES